jgi:hypothetical protein
LENLTFGELILIKYFLKNQSNILIISVEALSKDLLMNERNVIRALKGLIEKNLLFFNGNTYQLMTDKKENDVPTEVEEIIEPAVENEPKIEIIETSTENCFVDENGNKYIPYIDSMLPKIRIKKETLNTGV